MGSTQASSKGDRSSLLRCAERSEQIDHALSSGSCGHRRERRQPLCVADVEIGALAGEQLHHLAVTLRGRDVHRGVTGGIDSFDIAAERERCGDRLQHLTVMRFSS